MSVTLDTMAYLFTVRPSLITAAIMIHIGCEHQESILKGVECLTDSKLDFSLFFQLEIYERELHGWDYSIAQTSMSWVQCVPSQQNRQEKKAGFYGAGS